MLKRHESIIGYKILFLLVICILVIAPLAFGANGVFQKLYFSVGSRQIMLAKTNFGSCGFDRKGGPWGFQGEVH